jgi:outer membrane protein OmpA-like peptidoglycan-associated protein
MKRYLLFTLMSLISGFITFAQQPSEKLKQVFLDGEYFFLYEDYEEALYSYNTLYKRGFSDNGNINYRIGLCYLNIPGEKHKAIPYLEKAIQYANSKYTEGSFKETNAPLDAFFFLGNAYRISNDLDKAMLSYKKYKELIGSKNVTGINLANKEIEACNNAKEALKNPRFTKSTVVGRPVSTNSKDFYPAVSENESVIVYNSAQKFYDAVFFSKKVNNKWSTPINITPEIQSDGNQYVSSLSPDGTDLFLRIEDNYEADLFVSKYENGIWTKSKSVGKTINSKFFEGNGSVSHDGKVFYFSSNRPGGKGTLDLYKSELQADGTWGTPVNLGDSINTEFNEDAPFVTSDGKKLFFVSQGHKTMGGYDIYYSNLRADGKWSKPFNLGYPVNTTDDNAFYYPIADGSAFYTNMYLREGFGSDDIYKIWTNEELAIADYKKTIQDETQVNVFKEPAKEITREIPEEVVKKITDTVIEPKATEIYTLHTLFFDFNSAELTVASIKELDYLTMVMKNTPEIKVQLVGHTDAKGSDQYNQLLSERRSRAAKNYLVSKGIRAERVAIKGMGETSFIAINNNPDGSDNPDGRKFNRRVDINILHTKVDNIKIEPVEIPESLKIK